MKIVFLGSAEFSKIVLEELCKTHHKVVGIVTNLDKQCGRGHKLNFSQTKLFGLKKNIPVLQFKSISKEGFDAVKKLNPDILITASFGQILKQNILELAPFGVFNVHSSILPKYRGSCPINWAIINGETKTGVTIMKTDIGLDTGDIVLAKTLDILPDETAGELTTRLAQLGAQALIEALDLIETNKAKFDKQDNNLATFYPMLNKESGKIDFNKTAKEIQNLCNGLNPWPICFVDLDNINKLKVFKAKPFFAQNIDVSTKKIGEVVLADHKNGLVVQCKNGLVLLDVIQASNSRAMKSSQYLNGKSIEIGKIF